MRVITNSLGSCDWITIQDDAGNDVFAGHSIGARDLVDIINNLGGVGKYREEAILVEVDDEQMEEGNF